ncbi:DUF1731 domain-containing protein, partial [bacterium]|nr:DUF1731 domain-containing protein [bacterium]
LVRDWEAEAQKFNNIQSRLILMRIGLVLSKKGGALQKMILPFSLGLGGNLGHGQQYMSWIHIDDLIKSIFFLIENDSISGAVNLVSPEAIKNKDFTKTLAKTLKRPAFFHVPEIVLNVLIKEMAQELLMPSFRVIPKKLVDQGFSFQYTELQDALVREIS